MKSKLGTSSVQLRGEKVVFQVNVTILRWLELRDDEHLELECGEDIDTVQSGPNGGTSAETRLLEQIKARSARSVTLRSEEALEALSNFCSHRAANPTSKLKFRYITTANSGVEQGWDRPESGIETWSGLRRGRYDDTVRHEAIQALRIFLKSCARPQRGGPVKEKLEQVEATARAISFPLLEAAAVRTRIMVLAEWEDQLGAALALSESSLNRFDSDDCRFLIMEVTGRPHMLRVFRQKNRLDVEGVHAHRPLTARRSWQSSLGGGSRSTGRSLAWQM